MVYAPHAILLSILPGSAGRLWGASSTPGREIQNPDHLPDANFLDGAVLDLAQRGTPDTHCFCRLGLGHVLSLPRFPNRAADGKQHSSPLTRIKYKIFCIFL